MSREISDDEPRKRVLNGNTLLPLSLVVTLLVQSLGAYIWLEQRFGVIERQLFELQVTQRDRWSTGDQRGWAGDLAIRNRSLDVPPVQRVRE